MCESANSHILVKMVALNTIPAFLISKFEIEKKKCCWLLDNRSLSAALKALQNPSEKKNEEQAPVDFTFIFLFFKFSPHCGRVPEWIRGHACPIASLSGGFS